MSKITIEVEISKAHETQIMHALSKTSHKDTPMDQVFRGLITQYLARATTLYEQHRHNNFTATKLQFCINSELDRLAEQYFRQQCTECGNSLPPSAFPRRRSTPRGTASKCKTCHPAYTKENPNVQNDC